MQNMMFIDLEKVHDKVSRELLWKYLDVRSVLVAYSGVIKGMYDGSKTRG